MTPTMIARLVARIKHSGASQAEVALRAGISPTSVSRSIRAGDMLLSTYARLWAAVPRKRRQVQRQ